MNDRQRCIARARLLRREGKTYNEIRAVIGPVDDESMRMWLRGVPRPAGTYRSHPKLVERRAARRMRMAGATYDEIVASLAVSKASLHLWLKDLPVPERVRERRADAARNLKRRGSRQMQIPARERRDARVSRAVSSVTDLSPRDLFMLGLALYWAEGSKDKPWRRAGRVSLTNSDLAVIQVFLAWLELVGVQEDELTFCLSVHESADVRAQETWWQEQLGLPPERFRRPMVKRHRPSTNRRNTGSEYHGCLVVIAKRPTALYDAIDGWWQGIARRLNDKEAGADRVALGSDLPGSSKGRTASFGVAYGGSNPSPGAEGCGSSPWLPLRWWRAPSVGSDSRFRPSTQE